MTKDATLGIGYGTVEKLRPSCRTVF